jgi:RNase H-fold protein (predicted Holliday junction resolvase)
VEAIVIGDPGKENKLYKPVHDFGVTLGEATGLPIHFQNEAFTSLEADRFTDYRKPTARLQKQSTEKKNDASAAALILQRFLDRQNVIQSKHDND